MRGAFLAGVIALTCVAIYAGGRAAAGVGSSSAERVSVDAPRSSRPETTVLPLVFEENRGQGGAPERFDFLVRCRGYHAFVSSGEVVFSFDGAPLSMSTVGATPREPDVAGLRLPGKSNYLIGKDESKWITDVPQTRGARYRDTAPGVRWTFGGDGRALEFAFDVAPGAESPQLVLEGAKDVGVADDGSLRVEMPHGVATMSKPVAWQNTDERVEAAWVVDGTNVRVALGAHDGRRAVHVDPTVLYATYFGGGSGTDSPTAIAVDGAGSVYFCGTTESATFPYPTTAGAYRETSPGIGSTAADGFVTKILPTGAAPAYSTYIGSSGHEGFGSIAVNAAGEAVVCGTTNSGNYPTTAGAYNTMTGIGDRPVVTKLSAAGSGLAFSTFLSGTSGGVGCPCVGSGGVIHLLGGWDGANRLGTLASDGRSMAWQVQLPTDGYTGFSGMCRDAFGNLYVVGLTQGSSFPTTAGAFDSTLSGPDAFLMKLSPAGSVVYATLLGGSGHDQANAVGVNLAQQPYVTGYTYSADFPVTADAYQNSSGIAGQRTFVTRFLASGAGLRYSTYFRGTDGYPVVAAGIAVHPTGSFVVTGFAQSLTLPVLLPWQNAPGWPSEGFASKFERTGTLAWSSYIGGSGADYGRAVAMAADGTVTILGKTGSADIPMVSPYQSARASCFLLSVGDDLVTDLAVPAIGAALPDSTVGIAYSQVIPVTGGLGPYKWTQVSGALAPGLTISTTGTVSGTPTQAGNFQVMMHLEDSCDLVADSAVPLRINAVPAAVGAIVDWTAGREIDWNLPTTGGTGGLVFTLEAGQFPAGTGITTGGRVFGTPAAAGDSSFRIRVTDALGATSSRTVTWHVAEYPSLDAHDFAEWTETRPFSHQFTMTGGSGAKTWRLLAGELPVYQPFDTATGTMDGTTKDAGDYAFTMQVTDGAGATAWRDFAMKVNEFPEIVSAELPLAFAGRPYRLQLLGTGGTAPLRWSLASLSLPEGLTLSDAVISGTPAVGERRSPTILFSDASGAVATRLLLFEVAAALDLASKKTAERLSISADATASFKRYLELLDGTLVNASLKLKGKGVFTADLALTGPDGAAIDVTAFKKTTPRSVAISRLPVPATGRYVLSIVRGPDSDGQATLSVSIAPQAKWPGTGAVAAAGTTEFAFSAPPGAVATIVAKAAKGSAALPKIVTVLDEDGVDVSAGVVAREKGGSAALKLAAPLAGGRYRVRFVGRDGTAGAITWSVGLKRPKTYDFALPELGAGDGL